MSEFNIHYSNHVYAVERPDDCPICHHHSQFTTLSTTSVGTGNDTEIEVILRCGYEGCNRAFICYYPPPFAKGLLRVVPLMPVPRLFPEITREISPSFMDIYDQAEVAHSLGLTHVAGPGYRKAFEFLVKDYAIGKAKPEEDSEVKIQAILAGRAADIVKTYFAENPKLQALAERVLWLGNDETHYMRKWQEHDIDDLVKLIKITLNWLDTEHLTNSTIAEMAKR